MDNLLKLKLGWLIVITCFLNAFVVLFDVFLSNIPGHTTLGYITVYFLAIEFALGSIAGIINIFYKNDSVYRISMGIALGSIASFVIGVVVLLYLVSGHVC